MADFITFFEGSSFRQQVTLEGTLYVFEFNWNDRGSMWTLTIKDFSQNCLVAGIRLVQGIDLFAQYPDRGLPPGALFTVDDSGDLSDIEQNDFIGDRQLKLVYLEESEVDELIQ